MGNTKFCTLEELRVLKGYTNNATKLETKIVTITEAELMRKVCEKFTNPIPYDEALLYYLSSIQSELFNELLSKTNEEHFSHIVYPRFWMKHEADVYYFKSWCYGFNEEK